MKVVGVLALAGSMCAPLLMHLTNAGYMPPRTVLAFPLFSAGLVFAASFNRRRTLKIALGVLVLGVLLQVCRREQPLCV